MLKIESLSDFSDYSFEDELSIIEQSIASTSSTVSIPFSKFSHFEKLGFKEIEVNETPFEEMVDDALITHYELNSPFCFEKQEGAYTTRIFLSQWDFTPWEGKDVTYLLVGKVFYKDGEYFRKQKPAIIYHHRIQLTSSFTIVTMNYFNGEVDALVHTDEIKYRKKISSLSNIFVSYVEYENAKKISDVYISAFQNEYNLNDLSDHFPAFKDFKFNSYSIQNFEKLLAKDDKKLLEMFAV